MSRYVVLFMVALAGISFGCRKGPAVADRPPKPPVVVDPNQPEETLYEQIRAGSTQIEGVIDTLDAVLERVKKVDSGTDKEVRAVVEDLKDSLDAAGATLADFAGEAPDRKTVEKQFAKYDEWRIQAIAAGNDARHEMIDAQGLADTLSETAEVSGMDDVADLLEVGIADLKDAIETLGGKIEG